jgi:RNA polymerase sigma-70 factor, ECF subfamily
MNAHNALAPASAGAGGFTAPATTSQKFETATAVFQRDLIALIPQLRAFGYSLCKRRDQADDLAQEALAKAWRSQTSFEPGTNLKAWTFFILRNEFYSQRRTAWRQTHWDEIKGERIAAPPDGQHWAAELCDTAEALRGLPDGQREALVLVGAGGVSYLDAAKICGTRLGTLKSRVARGRAALCDIIEGKTELIRNAAVRRVGGTADILAQLSALVPAGAAA